MASIHEKMLGFTINQENVKIKMKIRDLSHSQDDKHC